MDVDAALSEVPVNIAPLVDSLDGVTIEACTFNQAGLVLIWNFTTCVGAYTQTAVTPTDTGGNYDWVSQGNGMFTIEIPPSGGASINNDTEGFGWFTGTATGICPWRGPVIGFRAAGLNDKLIESAYDTTRALAGTALPAAAADAAGGLPISDAGGLDVDAIKTMTDKIGTITNTGGTATVGAILGDFANSALVTRVEAVQADIGDASASTLGSIYAILGNAAATITGRLPAALGSDGFIKASLWGAMGTALTETAGQIKAAIVKFFDVATPVLTCESVNQAQDNATTAEIKTAIEAAGSSLALILADTGTDGVVVASASKTGYALAAGALGIAHITLIDRIYEMINNKMLITEATGVASLKAIGGATEIASGSVTSAAGTTTRLELTWA